MTNRTTSFEDFPAEWKLLGGRGLSAKILNRDCDPICDPLGPDNSMKFDVSQEVINSSKIRFDPRPERYEMTATG